MKKLLFLFIFIYSITGMAQTAVNLYNPEADAMHDLDSAIALAKQTNKHVLVQVGGNWCSWCVKLHKFYTSEPALDSLIQADYVTVRVNYSKENKNPEAMKRLAYPQRFGFPVLLVLDGDGNRLHTQNSAYLEEGSGYSSDKITSFLQNWTTEALLEPQEN